MIASDAADDITAAASSLGYPRAFMPGIKIDPSAATSATELPEISAKIIEATIDTIAKPPRKKPTNDRQKPIRRREIEVAFISAPASTNSGIAISGNLPAPSYNTI